MIGIEWARISLRHAISSSLPWPFVQLYTALYAAVTKPKKLINDLENQSLKEYSRNLKTSFVAQIQKHLQSSFRRLITHKMSSYDLKTILKL